MTIAVTSAIASAPGKVVIAGEYAVLHGAPAISMAVDRRSRVTVSPGSESTSSLETLGYRDGRRWFRQSGGAVDWLENASPGGGLELFEAVLAETHCKASGPMDYLIDSSAFADRDTGLKYGFGSSAAVAVALTAACLGPGDNRISTLAGRAHRRFQQGSGSGIDIATSVHGGVIRFQRGAEVEAMSWPQGLEARILWSGASASTGEKIRGLGTEDASEVARKLADAAQNVCDCWKAGDPSAVLSALADFVDRLADFDASKARGIFEAGHAELVQEARAFNDLVYKPCGAGGGDVGMAFSTSARSLAAFCAAAELRGICPLDVALDPVGVRCEGTKA